MGDAGVNWTLHALRGARIIDDLLVRFGLCEEDSAIVDEALRYLADAARVPGQPINGGVRRALRQRGLLVDVDVDEDG